MSSIDEWEESGCLFSFILLLSSKGAGVYWTKSNKRCYTGGFDLVQPRFIFIAQLKLSKLNAKQVLLTLCQCKHYNEKYSFYTSFSILEQEFNYLFSNKFRSFVKSIVYDF